MDHYEMQHAVIRALQHKLDALEGTLSHHASSIEDYAIMTNGLASALSTWLYSFDSHQSIPSSDDIDYSREVIAIYNKNFNI